MKIMQLLYFSHFFLIISTVVKHCSSLSLVEVFSGQNENIFALNNDDDKTLEKGTVHPTVAQSTMNMNLLEILEKPAGGGLRGETNGSEKESKELTPITSYQEPVCPNEILLREMHELRASNEYNEVSYLAVSSQEINGESIMWLGNDGNVNEITAATISGRIVRKFKLDFPFSGDAETISLGPCSSLLEDTTSCLYIGFLGNNKAHSCKDRTCVDGNEEGYIFKTVEPDISSYSTEELKGVTLVLNYSKTLQSPTSRADCEAIFVDFTGDKISGKPGDIYVVTKMPRKKSLTRVFLFPVSGHENVANGSIVNNVVMELVAKPKEMIWTGADIARQGNFISGKSYGITYIWSRNIWTSTVAMALEEDHCSEYTIESNDDNDRQFESTAFLPNGTALVEISECARGRGCNPNIWITYIKGI